MFIAALSNLDDLTMYSRIGMIIFFVCFVLIVGWAFTRTRRQLQDWSAMPLSDGQPEGIEQKGTP